MYKERALLLTLVFLTTLKWVSGSEAPVEMKAENEIEQEKANEKVETKTKTVLSNSIEEPESGKLETEETDVAEETKSARIVLDSTNFEETVKYGYTFVKFYAPWCGHCAEMAPDWNDLANHFFKHPISGIDLTIAEVDCTEASLTCRDENVDGYPTIKLYKDGSVMEDFFFARTLDRMKRFLAEKLFNIDQLESNSLGLFTLNDLIFNKFIEDSRDVPVVVKFYVPGCIHCQELQEVYDELVIKFLMEESEEVKFAEVNCMDMDSLDTCTEEGVEGFPAVHIYKDGIIEDVFDEERNVDALSNFVWQTVDPTRVTSDMDDFLNIASLMGGMGGMGGGQDEFEECDCSEPDCECEEEDDEGEFEDDEYEEGEYIEEDSEEEYDDDDEEEEEEETEENRETSPEEEDIKKETEENKETSPEEDDIKEERYNTGDIEQTKEIEPEDVDESSEDKVTGSEKDEL